MDEKISNMKNVEFGVFLRMLARFIEKRLGEPQNPDEMLDEAQELSEMFRNQMHEATNLYRNASGIDNAEDRAFKDLKLSLKNAKKWVIALAGEKWLEPLSFHNRMPRSREKVKELVRAILSAWDDHSSDPELQKVILGFQRLRTAYDAFIIAWDKQEDANRLSKDKHREYHETRKRAEEFIRKVKNYLAIYLDPYDFLWSQYGFEPRKRRGEK